MSYRLHVFFQECAAHGFSLYMQRPILQVEVPGVVGKVTRIDDNSSGAFEVTFLSTGENAEYPKETPFKTCVVKQSDDVKFFSVTDNALTLGEGKQILGFAAYETKLSVIDRSARLKREVPYPDHSVLGLSIAFIESGKLNYMNGTVLATPRSVLNDPLWQKAHQSPRVALDIGA